jgi:hypothetical protein
MPAWDSLDENSKRVFARQMEVYAGYSENADHHVGRSCRGYSCQSEIEERQAASGLAGCDNWALRAR